MPQGCEDMQGNAGERLETRQKWELLLFLLLLHQITGWTAFFSTCPPACRKELQTVLGNAEEGNAEEANEDV
jgi:hypothetical protein